MTTTTTTTQPLPPDWPPGLPPVMGGLPTAVIAPPSITATASNVVLLRNVPSFLQFSLKDWILPCGAARKVIVCNGTCLVTMMHGDGALKLVCAVKYLAENQAKGDSSIQTLQAQLVPASPDIPLPVSKLEESITKNVGDELWKLWNTIKDRESKDKEVNDETLSSAQAGSSAPAQETKALDADRVAAAAGGAYDEDADPLNAPAVLEAVKKFRSHLLKKEAEQKKERQGVVAKRIEQMMPLVKERLEQERMAPPQPSGLGPHSVAGIPPPLPPPPPIPGVPVTGLPPPPPVPLPPPGAMGMPPPLPPGLPPPPPPPTGTVAPPVQPPTAAAAIVSDEPPAKRVKLETTTTNFPIVPTSLHTTLRAFISCQIQELLGEEEATLIDFIYTHVLEGKTYAALQEELFVVLEEDAPTFVETLKKQVLAEMT